MFGFSKAERLLNAIDKGDELKIQKLCKEGVNCNQAMKNIPLLFAIDKNEFSIAKMLIEYGANINVCNNEGVTPLLAAYRNTNIEFVKFLISKGADINNETDAKNDRNILLAAVENGNADLVKYLLEQNSNVNIKDNQGNSPLIVAIGKNETSIAKLLIQNGADINTCNGNGANPLLLAFNNKNDELTKYLITMGADINAATDVMNGKNILLLAVENKDIELTNFLLEHKADVNVKTKFGQCPLSIAIQNEDLDTINLLIKHNADVNLRHKGKEVPMSTATMIGNNEIINLLEKSGAKPPKFNSSEIIEASRQGDIAKVQELIKKNANLDYTGDGTVTALMYAAQNNHHQIVELLLKSGAKPNLVDNKNGCTALFYACNVDTGEESSYLKTVKLLLKYGAKPNLKANNDWFPLMCSARIGTIEIAKALINKGADKKLKHQNTRTAYDFAWGSAMRNLLK